MSVPRKLYRCELIGCEVQTIILALNKIRLCIKEFQSRRRPPSYQSHFTRCSHVIRWNKAPHSRLNSNWVIFHHCSTELWYGRTENLLHSTYLIHGQFPNCSTMAPILSSSLGPTLARTFSSNLWGQTLQSKRMAEATAIPANVRIFRYTKMSP